MADGFVDEVDALNGSTINRARGIDDRHRGFDDAVSVIPLAASCKSKSTVCGSETSYCDARSGRQEKAPVLEPQRFFGHSQSDPQANILLVDDHPANLLALHAILDDPGLNLVDARSGEAALQEVQSDGFAVVLLDVSMPGISGIETAKRIREQLRSCHTPITFLTAYDADRAQLEEANAFSAVEFLAKPLLPFMLRAKVRGFVELL